METLKEDAVNCGTDPAVGRITWEGPGQVLTNGKTASLINIPNQFSSPSSLRLGLIKPLNQEMRFSKWYHSS
jgi:hypothetical protein